MAGDSEVITLYKQDSKGKIRMWSIESDDYELCMTHGLLDGEQQETLEYVDENLSGRSQEEQLMLTINSKIKKKRDKGYVSSEKDAMENQPTNQLGLSLPMLASRLKDHKNLDFENLTYQYKYNGFRCLIHNTGHELIAYSRNGMSYTAIHEILGYMANHIPVGETLDGEIYRHDTKLNKIASLVKKRQDETSTLKYVVYDCMDFENVYSERRKKIENWIGGNSRWIELAPILPFKHSVKKMLNHAIDIKRFEGLIARLDTHPYQSDKRSKSLVKIKRFDDAEFVVVDIIPSKEEWAILKCVMDDGQTFTVSCHGTHRFKRMVLEKREMFLGATVNVEFSEITAYGKPFHPISTGFVNRETE